jgi:hypothetical protein
MQTALGPGKATEGNFNNPSLPSFRYEPALDEIIGERPTLAHELCPVRWTSLFGGHPRSLTQREFLFYAGFGNALFARKQKSSLLSNDQVFHGL